MALLKRTKFDLPVHNSSFRPRRPGKGLTRLLWAACICLLLVWTVLRHNRRGGASFPATEAVVHEAEEEDRSQLYIATKDGIVDGNAELSEEQKEQMIRDTVETYDLNQYSANPDGDKIGDAKGDVVLFLMPLRNAEHVMPMAFQNIMNLTYDHSLIDIAFLVSDCSPGDTTLQTLFEYSILLQNGTLADHLLEEEERQRSANVKTNSDLYKMYMDQGYMENVRKAYNPESHHAGYKTPFRSVSIYVKDFGQAIGQGFSDRHAVKVQGIRRKLMGRARNWLTASALRPYHSWVYWRDVDIETCPGTVIQDLMKFNYDVMVPNIWRPLPTFLGSEQAYDLNSWVESEPALELAKTLEEDDVIVEGYAEYPTYRVHLGYIRGETDNPDEVLDLDGVGGVSILAKAKIFRQGVHFPAFTFRNHAETEAFGKMARAMGFSVGGLPNYTIWHIYEPSEDDLKKIAGMERKKRRQKHTR